MGGVSIGQVSGGGGGHSCTGPASSAERGEGGWGVHSAGVPTPVIETVERKKKR